MADFVDASPAKRFFIDMLVRDIRLEDAVLDLVDNAMDSLLRTMNIDLETLVTPTGISTNVYSGERFVSIEISPVAVTVEDNCGGIDIDHAIKHVFRFGTDERPRNSRLSVYGIGLKRAVFKIGRRIVIESKTLESGFRVTMDVSEFAAPNAGWQFPIERIEPAMADLDCGTRISICDIAASAAQRFGSGSFRTTLTDAIASSYSLFLNRFVRIRFNGADVQPTDISITNSAEVSASITRTSFEDVDIVIVAGLQALEGGEWRGLTAGWYIVCNGRVVVFADKSSLSGWGAGALPGFQPKHRGFIGVALFISNDPETLPWTTTKRGVNAESPVFQFAKELMMPNARPVITFLDRRYASVPVSSENTDNLAVNDKTFQQALRRTPVGSVFGSASQAFGTSSQIGRKARTTSVQFRTERKNIERARRAIGDPNMAAGKVGLHALTYFLDNELDNETES